MTDIYLHVLCAHYLLVHLTEEAPDAVRQAQGHGVRRHKPVVTRGARADDAARRREGKPAERRPAPCAMRPGEWC